MSACTCPRFPAPRNSLLRRARGAEGSAAGGRRSTASVREDAECARRAVSKLHILIQRGRNAMSCSSCSFAVVECTVCTRRGPGGRRSHDRHNILIQYTQTLTLYTLITGLSVSAASLSVAPNRPRWAASTKSKPRGFKPGAVRPKVRRARKFTTARHSFRPTK